MSRVAVGMSGGTDSAAAALLLKQAGETPVGVTLLLSGHEDVAGAEAVCKALEMEFHTVDMREAFRERVIRPFAESYLRGETPNPCVLCNREIKFGLLLEASASFACDTISTGHYARNVYRDGSFHLLQGVDSTKDQSYFLWTLKQENLSKIRFPLGEMTKAEVRQLVQKAGLPVQSRESQDICFVPEGDCGGYLAGIGFAGTPGEIRETDGKLLGHHNGLGRYTIGQRKGLGISSTRPLYVIKKDAETNTVWLGGEDELFTRRVFVRDVQMVSGAPLASVSAQVRLRYTRASSVAQITPKGNGAVLEFERPQRAPAAGQSAVFYREDAVLGGGFIATGEI